MKDIISNEQLKVIDIILEKFPNVVFGGSIALNVLGLIDRPIGDIDIFYTSKKEYSDWLKTQPLENSSYQNDVEMLGYITHRIGAQIKGVKICGFEIPEGKETEAITKTVCGRKLQIQNPVYAIIAKAIYSSKTEKHAKDLVEIQKNLQILMQ